MKKNWTIIVFGIIAAALVIYGVSVRMNKSEPTIETGTSSGAAISTAESEDKTETPTEAESSSADENGASEEEISVPEGGYKYAYAGFDPKYADIEGSEWNLLLVNRDYILPDDFEVKLAPAVESDPDGAQLDYRVAPHYNEMFLAAEKDGIELTPVSGYRSIKRQTNNFENKIETYMDEGYSKAEATKKAATIILPPGTSEHNAGLAMDICSLYESFDQTDEYKWLCENAADYGFILRYPKDKVDKTNIIYEPWHWRYVGVETAKAVKASGLCYEEYLGLA